MSLRTPATAITLVLTLLCASAHAELVCDRIKLTLSVLEPGAAASGQDCSSGGSAVKEVPLTLCVCGVSAEDRRGWFNQGILPALTAQVDSDGPVSSLTVCGLEMACAMAHINEPDEPYVLPDDGERLGGRLHEQACQGFPHALCEPWPDADTPCGCFEGPADAHCGQCCFDIGYADCQIVTAPNLSEGGKACWTEDQCLAEDGLEDPVCCNLDLNAFPPMWGICKSKAACVPE